MAGTIKTLSVQDQVNFFEMANNVRNCLKFSIVNLKVLRDTVATAAQRASIEAEVLKLEGDLALLDNHTMAVVANEVAITPPTPDQVSKVKDLLGEVNNATAASHNVEGIIGIANQALAAYQKIKGGG